MLVFRVFALSTPKLTLILLITVLLAAFLFSPTQLPVVASSSTDDWPMFNHDPQHTSYSASSVSANPVLIWTFPNPNITSVELDHNFVTSTPALADGYLYISGANGGGFYCLNASTGLPIWSNPNIYVAASSSSPAVYKGYVYVGISGLITALNALTGTQVWRSNFTNIYRNPDHGGPPVAVDGMVYVQGYRNLYALNASTGAKIWSYPNQGSFGNAVCPAVANGYVYAVSYYGTGLDITGYIFALDDSTGKEIWTYATGKALMSSPVVYGGRVYIGSDDRNVYALNALTGALVWNYTTVEIVDAAPAVANGIVYIRSFDGTFYAFNASTGTKIWNYTIGNAVASSPAVADEVVYVSGNDRYLYALNATTGDLLWKNLTITASDYYAAYFTGMYASPAVAYGNIYIGTNEGNVLAFGNAPNRIVTPPPSLTSVESLFVTTLVVIILFAASVFIVKKWIAKKRQQEAPHK
jgi:outer membrane protein assembly factor BamB